MASGFGNLHLTDNQGFVDAKGLLNSGGVARGRLMLVNRKN